LDKGCVNCHAADQMRQGQTPVSLAAAMWNHSPEMWQAQKQRNIRPVLTSMEAADVFAYFFSLAYLKTPGDPAKGKTVFETKSCSTCHDTKVGGRKSGPPISTWSEVDDPLSWAEHMWNHSRIVYADTAGNAMPWPQFSTSEMADMLAYLRSLPESHSHPEFQPGDPQKGRITFENACESCHSFGNRTATPKIDLLKRSAPDLLMGYVAAMWNHAPYMHERAGVQFPIFGPGDMSNLVAYLFTQRYFDEQGDARRGAAVYEAKGCASCHERWRKETGAPDLTAATEQYSPITIAASLFRHGPAMLETMKKENVQWPHFTPREMEDLIGFLNSRLMPSIAVQEK
ncbi:MAG TPA: c-type cytochrome, partial [Terriglobia bacterium]|nr:c-type cytochrome [Terriglobia bacterium]